MFFLHTQMMGQMPAYDPFRSQRSRATDIYDANVGGSQYTPFPQQNPVMPIMV